MSYLESIIVPLITALSVPLIIVGAMSANDNPEKFFAFQHAIVSKLIIVGYFVCPIVILYIFTDIYHKMKLYFRDKAFAEKHYAKVNKGTPYEK